MPAWYRSILQQFRWYAVHTFSYYLFFLYWNIEIFLAVCWFFVNYLLL
jgi:hypothetical protein